jgi:hypothetical protein
LTVGSTDVRMTFVNDAGPVGQGPRSRPKGVAPDQAILDHEAALATVAAISDDVEDLLSALQLLRGLREHLDDLERQLIESARDGKASWLQIAGSLGLATRQAAEQRWLRLRGESKRDPVRTRAERQRQRSVDIVYGPEIGALRAAVLSADRRLGTDPSWDDRFPRAALLRITLALAGTAEPGALFTLAAQAVTDFDEVQAAQFTPTTQIVLNKLRQAVRSATPPGRS